jgi:uncharacterized integral membrane protein
MVKTKLIKNKKHSKRWATITAGLFLFFLLLITFLSRPVLSKVHGEFLISQGILFPAVVMSAVFWALIELFTPPGRTYTDLLVRYIPALIIGLIVGGALGYFFNFGELVIVPAYNGNIDAIFFLIIAFLSGTGIIADAVWEHDKGFLGQHGAHIKKTNYNESGKSKGRRLIIVSIILFVFIFIAPFFGSSIGHDLVSIHDDNAVLSSSSGVVYVYTNSGAVPFAVSNNTATYDANSTIVYSVSGMTIAQMNQYAVSHIELKTSFSKYNLTLGTGTDSSFSPLAEFHVNSSSFNIPISESYLTGNQSNHLVLKIQTPVIESESVSIVAYGDSSAGSLFGPAVLLDGTYIVGGIIAGLSTIFGLGFVDIDISRIKPKRRVN